MVCVCVPASVWEALLRIVVLLTAAMSYLAKSFVTSTVQNIRDIALYALPCGCVRTRFNSSL